MKREGNGFLIGALLLIVLTGVFIDYGWRAPYAVASFFGAQFCLMLWGMSEISRLGYEREGRIMDAIKLYCGERSEDD